MTADLQRVVEHIHQTIDGLATAVLEIEYEYSCVPLCIIDAVFSMGVRYESTRRTVIDFCREHQWEISRAKSPIEHKVSELIEILKPYESQFETIDIFKNRQRTSSRSGITKAEAVYRFAKILENHDIQTLSDALNKGNDLQIKRKIQQIKGQTSGISFSYFLILVGHRDVVKPDRMIRRFIAGAIRKSSVGQDYADEMVVRASGALNKYFPNLTPAALDNAIWKYQRNKAGEFATSDSPILSETTAPSLEESFEMANFYPRTTGLPMTVWVSPRGKAHHDVRIKVNMAHGNQTNLDNAAIVAVRPTPQVIDGHLASDDLHAVFAWITRNESALVAYWDGDTDTAQLVQALKPLLGGP